MVATVSVHEAKTHLSKLIVRALEGEEVVISRRKQPAVKLVPIEEPAFKPRVPGSMAGQFSATPDAFDPLTDDELREWGLL